MHEGPLVRHPPQFLGALAGERVLDAQRAAQAYDVFGSVRALDSGPARAFAPLALQLRDFLLTAGHQLSPLGELL
jgi:hypothetical protein